jgi:DNA-directed RNA polymerase subunit RPC12/RpoP
MTTVQRTTIEPSDIKAVELECVKCGSRHTIPLGQFKTGDGVKCSNCGSQWPVGHHDAHQDLVMLIRCAEKIAGLKGNAEVPFIIRFEITETAAK